MPRPLRRLLRTIESGYNPDNPYHNATHAADVLQTLHVIIHGAQLHAGGSVRSACHRVTEFWCAVRTIQCRRFLAASL